MRLMHCTIKEVAQKEEKKGHLTSEDNGQPNFKGRMMADPLIIGPVIFLELKVGRSPMVVKEQFPFAQPHLSRNLIPGFWIGHGAGQGLRRCCPLVDGGGYGWICIEILWSVGFS